MKKELLKIEKNALTLDGEPFYMASGDLHYFRVHPTEWRQRLSLMKDFGLNTVQTYCPWNAHEPREGEFDFSGDLDLAAFLALAGEMGFKVLLRPAPYICSEWDNGGLPAWLLKCKDITLRSSDPRYLEPVLRYTARICREFVPYLSTNGGPVIAVDIENEYGGYGNDLAYLRAVAACLSENGVDVPLYQTDNSEIALWQNRPLGVWQGVNYRIDSEKYVRMLQEIQPEKVPFVGEYWCGRAVYWEESGAARTDIPEIAAAYRRALEMGALVNFYMFCGGTNFGFKNGARHVASFDKTGRRTFRAITTSYQVDALVSEDGHATEKYYACRRELDAYLGRPVRETRVPDPPMQAISPVTVTEFAPLFENLDALTAKKEESLVPMSFEELDNPYGFVLYSVDLPPMREISAAVKVAVLHDRATCYADGAYLGTMQRDRTLPPVNANGGARLSLLVENMGRSTRVTRYEASKGLPDGVMWSNTYLFGWENRALPMEDLAGLRFDKTAPRVNEPGFYRVQFHAKAGVGTHLDTKGLGKGFAVVNGKNIGRFWCAGPQQTLYVPGGLLADGENELILFELYPTGAFPTVAFLDHAILDGEFTPA